MTTTHLGVLEAIDGVKRRMNLTRSKTSATKKNSKALARAQHKARHRKKDRRIPARERRLAICSGLYVYLTTRLPARSLFDIDRLRTWDIEHVMSLGLFEHRPFAEMINAIDVVLNNFRSDAQRTRTSLVYCDAGKVEPPPVVRSAYAATINTAGFSLSIDLNSAK